ncbi:MAG: VWA domain-containing protein [Spirochaetales bacterium]|jgi:Ca-activated chloride channel family protein|nr:VWA domain-containing protein [Spirochaetales bacterium]
MIMGFLKPSGLFIVLVFVILSGCTDNSIDSLEIVSGSENRELEFLIKDFCDKNNAAINISYMGSLDIMKILRQGGKGYDGVWPANSMWISLGDTSFKVKHTASIYQTPVVFGIKKSIARDLGFISKDVSVNDILKAIKARSFSFCMTSATQSNSGACAYISFLYAFLGNPQMISAGDLDNPDLQRAVTELLGGVNRSSGSSDWLKDLFLASDYDAMVNYETLIISANKRLREEGREPLYAIYPKEGVAMADSPLGYIDNGDPRKEKLFKKFQEYLLSRPIQLEIQKTGKRTGFIPISGENNIIFDKNDGIDINRTLSIVKMPGADTIEMALELYQQRLKKPSLTFYCLDFSGSMSGQAEKQLKEALRNLLDQNIAKQNLLSAGRRDEHVFILFSGEIREIIAVSGNDPQQLLNVYNYINSVPPGGGTNIYRPVIKCLEIMRASNIEDYISAVILMTDGESSDYSGEFKRIYEASGLDVPVFSIMFGEANPDQLTELAARTKARVFDGKTDLVTAFRNAKGYN